MLQTSVDAMPSISRKTITSRYAGGSASIASRMTFRVSPASSSSSGVRQAEGSTAGEATGDASPAEIAPDPRTVLTRTREGLTAARRGRASARG